MKRESSEVKGHATPWWKHGHVWLVIAGPAVVVVAGLVTAWIAVRDPDPVLAEDYYRRGVQAGKPSPGVKAHMPALQGRNHAATPAAEK
ncbi:MAG: FixH family protein [Pseudomonadota bacterium]